MSGEHRGEQPCGGSSLPRARAHVCGEISGLQRGVLALASAKLGRVSRRERWAVWALRDERRLLQLLVQLGCARAAAEVRAELAQTPRERARRAAEDLLGDDS